jgi:stage III sporulation protein SpoIIIAA
MTNPIETPTLDKIDLDPAETTTPEDNPAKLRQLQSPDDLQKLLAILPEQLRQRLEVHPKKEYLIEVVMDLGRVPEVRFPEGPEDLSDQVITLDDLKESITKVGDFGGDNRAGIERTLHRISAIRNRRGEVIGLTCRVGRAVFGTIGMIRDLVESGKSILMLGRPGVGKTTALREIARVLADDLGKRVVIIDSSNEIAGDGDVPHPAIGRARRMQVAHPELQHQVMIEAVENHTPEVIIIDEIGTELEAQAARTIAERGVQLVGTAHGNYLENLIKNPTLSDLVGGIQSVTLGDEEARRRGSQKSVLERKALPTFEIAVEMQERQKWTVHPEVSQTVDMLLRGRIASPEIRSVDAQGKIVIEQGPGSPVATSPNGRRNVPLGSQPTIYHGKPLSPLPELSPSWRSSGRMSVPTVAPTRTPEGEAFEKLLDQSIRKGFDLADDQPLSDAVAGLKTNYGPNGEELPVYVYPYGLGRHQLEPRIWTGPMPCWPCVPMSKTTTSCATWLRPAKFRSIRSSPAACPRLPRA